MTKNDVSNAAGLGLASRTELLADLIAEGSVLELSSALSHRCRTIV